MQKGREQKNAVSVEFFLNPVKKSMYISISIKEIFGVILLVSGCFLNVTLNNSSKLSNRKILLVYSNFSNENSGKIVLILCL
jgi:hypothetical protein